MLLAHLSISTDALFVDGMIGISQEDVGETGLQEVHGEEGGLLHNLQNTLRQSNRDTLRVEVGSEFRCCCVTNTDKQRGKIQQK